jgi:hypothetical protein
MPGRQCWMLFDTVSGNALDMTMDIEVAKLWASDAAAETNLAVIPFDVEDESDGPVSTAEKGGASQMAKKRGDELETEFEPKAEEGPDEPADDVAEAQPSLEEAAGGSTGMGPSSGGAAGESGGTTQAGNSGGAASSSPGG